VDGLFVRALQDSLRPDPLCDPESQGPVEIEVFNAGVLPPLPQDRIDSPRQQPAPPPPPTEQFAEIPRRQQSRIPFD